MTKENSQASVWPDEDIGRLIALYDDKLERADKGNLSPEADAELRALARIFDLNADGPAETLWPRLRGLLIKQAPAQSLQEPDMNQEPKNVLVVEDDVDAAAALTEALDEAGHRVIGPFHSAEAAEAATALHQIDLALLDINLSGAATGIDLAKNLKARWGVPVIFVSGDVSQAARHADIAAAMIIKPYSANDVLGAISRIETAS
ncbi:MULTISPECIES: response regulator [unclassified Brevundimonas]|uniref:response regulator n=1 Tax=unclassified Brevundimonas TaxID=2622653 RepID=UPI0025BCE030|nr:MULTISPECIES: response regulator [unclassified Brevundimonas]